VSKSRSGRKLGTPIVLPAPVPVGFRGLNWVQPLPRWCWCGPIEYFHTGIPQNLLVLEVGWSSKEEQCDGSGGYSERSLRVRADATPIHLTHDENAVRGGLLQEVVAVSPRVPLLFFANALRRVSAAMRAEVNQHPQPSVVRCGFAEGSPLVIDIE